MISVIIPSLNEEKYIESTLKSLKNQDYKGEREIIVVDGGSKDKTVKIAKKYADKVIELKQRGVARGRNAGAKEAKGDVLVFVDADTVLLFNALGEFSQEFSKKDVVGATCPIIPTSSQARDFILYWGFNQFVKASLKTRKPQVVGICFACRKKAFDKVGGFNEKIDIMEDFDLSERLSKLGKIKFNEKTFVLTSHRRIGKWGRGRSMRKIFKMYVNYLIEGTGGSADDYEPVR